MNNAFQRSKVQARPSGAPSVVLLHPACLFSTAMLVFNDHWLKANHPGILSGKLSDFAGLLLLPLVAHTAITLMASPNRTQRKLVLQICVLVSAIWFTLLEISPQWAEFYGHTLAILQSPGRFAVNALEGQPYRYAPVASTLDPSDLVALPVLWLAWKLGQAELASRLQS